MVNFNEFIITEKTDVYSWTILCAYTPVFVDHKLLSLAAASVTAPCTGDISEIL